ncbi:cytochrome ubiquinol oxidase subunit I [Apilactobacillus micheneri]|uniref:Cytochrome ubiquinol oxidase subunit I n=1 Tax=Apilactobacillus micheneri TaxID=1899430 RepID=A0A9Q8MTL4_9LACO|nr:cytochrome ubiquinol oxidase subunit I [Apilactobacillus micheneri]TPR39860.1 cytochrome ubiquinol oxidase subunit I [Apilactobacillus micheneri]TPR43781.1 cytochrome ubiquinol oxidase subunit I [Apilactobacillus micheneri]TPR45334.1 cytochrome ubiquinol oxidase subunit I [Apilactobacillus micheneri]
MFDFALNVLPFARFQFAMTTIFHYFFIPMSIGIGLAVCIMETMYAITKNKIYQTMTKFWGRIFLLAFAVGVVTGLIQEFQFGMNWSQYARFMGDIFGAPLAIEALLAFFLESTFLGVWMFTWDKFKPAWHALMIWLVFLASTASALWILTANSFMQHPVGYKLTSSGHVEMTSFKALLTNQQLWYEFPHVISSCIVTGSFIVAGTSAWMIFRKKSVGFFRKSMRLGLVLGIVGCLGAVTSGDLQSGYLIKDQPMKFAASEGIYNHTENPAPWSVFQLTNTKTHKEYGKIEVPYMLSFLSYHKFSGSVAGMDEANRALHKKYDSKFGKNMDYSLNVNVLFFAFRLMAAGFGGLTLISILGLWFSRRRKNTIVKQKWLTFVLFLATFAPFVINTGGWLFTELGRDPWVVYGLLPIADAVSPSTSTASVIFTIIVYFLLFVTLASCMVFYAKKSLYKGPESIDKTIDYDNDDPFSKEAFNK